MNDNEKKLKYSTALNSNFNFNSENNLIFKTHVSFYLLIKKKINEMKIKVHV